MVRTWSEVGHPLRSELVALAPPYRTCGSIWSLERGESLPLGSVVLGRGDATIAVLAELTALSYRSPWAVPCLAVPAHEEILQPLLMLVTELRDRLVLVARDAAHSDETAQVVACVRRRPAPGPAALARWVARRLRSRELEAPLRSQFEEGLGFEPTTSGLSVASYSRLFALYGQYTARDWRAVGRLALHAAAGPHAGEQPAAALPFRTATEYAKKYLGMSYHALAERLGWEWVLEASLRTGGYVAASCSTLVPYNRPPARYARKLTPAR
jgi:hypothetical protein